MEPVTKLPKPDWQTADGRVQLFNRDCAEILPLLSGVDVVITDPPYEIDAKGGGIVSTRKDLNETEGFTDCGFDYGLLSRFKNWVCFGTLKQVPKLIEAAAPRRYMLVTWNKQNPCPLVNGNYLPDTEYIVHAWSKGHLYGTFDDKARYIIHPLGDKEHGEHPNEKPAKVMAKMIRLGSKAGQLVFDPFMGSGTTGVVSLRLHRRFIGCEIVPKYFDIACERISGELNAAPLFEPAPIIQRSLIDD
jgi:site-specific DNA-methyltransferase (adenine-specific)